MIRLANDIPDDAGIAAAVATAVASSLQPFQQKASSLLSEHWLPLNEAAKMFPKAGGRVVSKPTLWRWATKGIHGGGMAPGTRALLATRKIGNTRYTSLEAIERFSDALGGPAAAAAKIGQILRSSKQRQRDHERACEKLRKMKLMD